MKALVKLGRSEAEGLRCADEENILFEITPYYLSLFHREGPAPHDRQIRAQVIPSRRYCDSVTESREKGFDMDFMGEKSTSPIVWISEHDNISEVLITGGDPLTLDNKYLDWLLGEVASIRHVERIRIGTRTPVTLPFRIDDGFIAVLKKYHQWGRR